MKNYLVLAVAILVSASSFAQKGDEEKREMLDNKRAEFIQKSAGLEENEVEMYMKLKTELRTKIEGVTGERGGREKRLDLEAMEEKEIEHFLTEREQRKVEVSKLELEFLPKFIENLGARKYAAIQRAEKEFRREVLREMRGRHGEGDE